MKRDQQWFIDRIGKKVKVTSKNAFNGDMLVKNETHAKYLCQVAQPHLGYLFDETESNGQR